MGDGARDKEIDMTPNKLRILYVDDDPNDRVIVERCLEKGLLIDFTLTTAQTAKECIEQLDGTSFDLLIVDYLLPDMTGLELVEELQESKSEIATIFLTGRGSEKIAVAAMKRGARDYVLKNDLGRDPGILISAIRGLVLEASLPKEVNRQAVQEVLALFSTAPTIEVDTITLLRTEPPAKLDSFEIVSTLQTLASMNFLEEKPVRSALSCPSCGRMAYVIYLRCPECRDLQIAKGDALEHYSCGCIDFRSKFDKGDGKFICPKCEKGVEAIGVDYRKVGSWYICSDNHSFGMPNSRLKCLECSEESDLEMAALQTLYEYRLSPKGDQMLRLGMLSADVAQLNDPNEDAIVC